MTLLQQSIQYIDRLKQLPSYTNLTPNEARTLKKKTVTDISSRKLQFVKDIAITMRDGAQIDVRIYRPKTMRKLPVLMYYHGGGWVINDINTSHESCIELAATTNHIVVSVNYRLAPEYKFPTPLHDAFDAFKWVKKHVSDLQALDKISVAGDSAGGNLAIAVSLLAAQQKLEVESQLLLYPVTDYQTETQSYVTYGTGYGLDQDVMKWFLNHYATTEEDWHNPLFSPLQADVKHLPKTFIVAAQFDVLHDEAVRFAQKLQQHNVPVVLHEANGLVHSYFTNNEIFSQQIAETITLMKRFLNNELSVSA